jgi:hypothetical protein
MQQCMSGRLHVKTFGVKMQPHSTQSYYNTYTRLTTHHTLCTYRFSAVEKIALEGIMLDLQAQCRDDYHEPQDYCMIVL